MADLCQRLSDLQVLISSLASGVRDRLATATLDSDQDSTGQQHQGCQRYGSGDVATSHCQALGGRDVRADGGRRDGRRRRSRRRGGSWRGRRRRALARFAAERVLPDRDVLVTDGVGVVLTRLGDDGVAVEGHECHKDRSVTIGVVVHVVRPREVVRRVRRGVVRHAVDDDGLVTAGDLGGVLDAVAVVGDATSVVEVDTLGGDRVRVRYAVGVNRVRVLHLSLDARRHDVGARIFREPYGDDLDGVGLYRHGLDCSIGVGVGPLSGQGGLPRLEVFDRVVERDRRGATSDDHADCQAGGSDHGRRVLVEGVDDATSREAGDGPVTQDTTAHAQSDLDDLRCRVSGDEVSPRPEGRVAVARRHVETGLVDPPVVRTVGPRFAHEVAIPVAVSVDIDAYLHAGLDARSTGCELDAGLTKFGERRRGHVLVEGCLVLARSGVGRVRGLEVVASVNVLGYARAAGVVRVPSRRVHVRGRGASLERGADLGGRRRCGAGLSSVPVVEQVGWRRAVRVVRQCAVDPVELLLSDGQVVLGEAVLVVECQRCGRLLGGERDGVEVTWRLGSTGLPGGSLGQVAVQRHVTGGERRQQLEFDDGQVVATVGVALA